MPYCPKCGEEVFEGFAFCSKCGGRLSGHQNKETGSSNHSISMPPIEGKKVSPALFFAPFIIGWVLFIAGVIAMAVNAETLKSWLGSRDKQIIYLDGCDHVLPLDLKKHEVAFHVAEFICRIAQTEAKTVVVESVS